MQKIFFNDIDLDLPNDFNPENFINLKNLFTEASGKPLLILLKIFWMKSIELLTKNSFLLLHL